MLNKADMNIEKEIDRRVLETGLSRLEVIASMNLGERSEAALRVLQKRAKRKELQENEPKEKLVLFHTGRGGQFNNGGYVTAKSVLTEKGFDPDCSGIHTFYSFENMTDHIREALDKKGIYVDDLATNWDQDARKEFNMAKIEDEDGCLITDQDLGDPIVTDEAGNECCTVPMLNSDRGTFDIDGEYDSYNWMPISDLDENEWKIVIRDLPYYQWKDEFLDRIKDKDLKTYLESLDGDVSRFTYCIFDNPKFDQVVDWERIEVYESEEEAENGCEDYVEINGRFYEKKR